jgi:hypothetical protein
MPDMDEPVNVDLEPEEALRILLGEERAEDDHAEPQVEESPDT